MNKVYQNKLIIAGKHIEHYSYEMPICKGYNTKRSGRGSVACAEDKELNRKKTAQRARMNVTRTINANYDLQKFMTLTFKDNVTDLYFAQHCFKVFIQRLKYKYKNLKYICVTEFQERGAVHFHLLTNLPYIRTKKLAHIWGNGFVKINKIDKVDNVGFYVTKYMTKDNIDERLAGRKCYSMSKNLVKPTILTDQKEIDNVLNNLETVENVYTKEFNTEHNGMCVYTSLRLAVPFVYRNFWDRLENKFNVQLTIPGEYLRNVFA